MTCTVDAQNETKCEQSAGDIYHVSIESHRLESVTYTELPPGDNRLQVKVDGASVIDQTFNYKPQSVQGPCSLTCNESPEFSVD
jgi:hypothetical protein